MESVQLFAVVVMGVSGCGKTSVGERLANLLEADFIEGDVLHSASNIAKMSGGIPLSDEDRWPWLDLIGSRAAETLARKRSVVVSCSALRRAYRDRLRKACGTRLQFVFLKGTASVLEARLADRSDHFMPTALLASQLATLEDPSGEDGVVSLDIRLGVRDLSLRAELEIRRHRNEVGMST